jgi:hypothetical protein
MADGEVIIQLSGGLQFDESILNTPPANNGVSSYQTGDYRYLLNMRNGSSIADNVGSPEFIASTYNDAGYYAWNGTEFASTSIPSGTHTALSKFEDKAKGKVYYCVYNTSGNHTVLCYVKSLRRSLEMLKWSGLNFNPLYYPSMCKIGKYLIITDKLNPIRILKVDGDADLGYTDAIYELKRVLAGNFSEFHISFAKWPPLAPPVARRNLVGNSDYTQKGIFQFTYRYVYVGGFKSTWAPPSNFITNEVTGATLAFNLYVPGYIFDYDTPANTSFQHSSIKFYQVVQFIELAYRESTRDPWKLFKRHTVDSGNNRDFEFSNNGPSARIPQSDIGQYFDSVPLKSGACESIDSRTFFADNEDEFPAITDFDVSDVEVYSVNPQTNSWIGPSTAFASLSGPEQVELGQVLNVRRMSFKERGIYKGAIVFQHFAGRTNLATTLDKWTWLIPSYEPNVPPAVEYYTALGFKIPPAVTPPDWAVAYQILRSNCLNIEYFVHGVINDYKFLQNDVNSMNDEITTPDDVKATMKDYFDNNKVISVGSKLFKRTFGLMDRILAEIRKNKLGPSFAASTRIYIDISNWVLTSKKNAAATLDWPANNVFYQFQQGDRVRFWGSTTANFNLGDLTRFDEEIITYTGKGIIINKPATLLTLKKRSDPGVNPSQAYLIEIYRPVEFNEESEVIFWEMGEWYPITQPGTASRDFAKRDFTWGGVAAVTVSTVNGHTIYNRMPLTNGDVWMVSKDFYFDFIGLFEGGYAGAIWPQMTQDAKRAFDYWEKNNGRPFAAYKYLPTETDKPTQARFGGKYLQDSLFLSINNFRDEDQRIYPEEYGRIRSLVNTANAQVESVGSILLAIGEVEAWSIYVNRTTLEDLNGQTSVALSEKVLGSYNTLLGSKGTLNPDSVSVRNGRVLWWNAKLGEWERYSRDGLTEVSEFGMKNWFKDLGDLIINNYQSTPPKALSTFDDYHKCWMTYINHADLPASFKGYSVYKCVTFAERNADKRWKEFLEYTPELFASMDNEVYSIIGTQVYIHEEGADFGSIYGVKKDAYIEVIINPEVRRNKIWQAMALEASDKWSFESIKGDWRSNSGIRQETRMQLDDLENKEWTFWTAIKKDKNTPNVATEQDGVVNGEAMRSKSLSVLLKLDPSITYYNVFNYLVAKYDDSPVNPKN